MTVTNKDKVREGVRDLYGKIARHDGKLETLPQVPSSCCSGEVYKESLCGTMGYSTEDMKLVPEGANMGLGCGNPVALASLKLGETVVDLGSGGGFDCFLAARHVGHSGRVIGVDMTPDMVSKARRNAGEAKAGNVEFRLGEIEHLPVGDNTADIVMSNCVINLSPDKHQVYRDAFRVLKPGGRLAISDILAKGELPERLKKDLASISACVGGAATLDETQKLLEAIGYESIRIEANQKTQQLLSQWSVGNSENASDYVVSAYIEAVKPIS